MYRKKTSLMKRMDLYIILATRGPRPCVSASATVLRGEHMEYENTEAAWSKEY